MMLPFFLVLVLIDSSLGRQGLAQITSPARLPRALSPRQVQGVAGYLKVSNQCKFTAHMYRNK
jgi:hypothetical protein